MAVGRAFRRRLGADVAAGAGLVVDQHGLPEDRRKLLRDPARADVDRAARRRGRDDAHRLGRIRLRGGGAGAEDQEQGEDASHGSSPVARSTTRGPAAA
jgi:hypothetical protein